MASSTQTGSSPELTENLPDVQLEVRQGSVRAITYSIDGIDFLIGAVPGCDLRVGAEAPGVLCLLARHPAGLSLRKLSPTQPILVNGQNVSQRELADGDRIQIGTLEFQVHLGAAAGGGQDQGRQEFHQSVLQFREQLVQFQREKDAFEKERRQPGAPASKEREILLEERAAEIEHQKAELAKTRQEMADLRRQLYDHYQERRDRLAALQEDAEKTKADLDEREKKLRLEEQDAADGRQRDRKRQEDLDRRTVEVTQQTLRFEEERRLFDQGQKTLNEEWNAKDVDVRSREQALADRTRDLDAKVKQYEADVLRLNRLQGDLEQRDIDLRVQGDELTQKRDQLQRDTQELHEQIEHFDEWRVKLADDAKRVALQKEEQDVNARQLAERAASLEGQQSTLAILRGRLERMREEIRTREQQLDEQRTRQETRDVELTRKQQEIEKLERDLKAEQEQNARDHAQWVERSAVMDAAVRQLKQAQDNLAIDKERLERELQELDALRRQHTDSDGVLQGRLAQLAETRERLDHERQALQQRSLNLIEREQACAALQEQLVRRTEEIAGRHKDIDARLQEHQAKSTDLDARGQDLDRRERELKLQIETWRCELEQKATALQQRHGQIADLDDQQREQLNQVAVQRKAHAEERAAFHLEQQAALEKLAQARADLESLRRDALSFIDQLPDAEVRAGAAVDRLGQAREQLRNHLGEIHQYVRQCQDELEQLRGRLQGELDKLTAQEQTLRRSQDEHRLALAAFRQQLIDWQGQIAELKRLLARDSTRLERKQAQVDERTKEVEAESQRLAEHAEQLQEQERDVAERREEIDRHLVDMRQWYRQKLRELAGIPLVPDTLKFDAEPTILPAPVAAESPSDSEDGDPGIVPTGRSILSITSAVDQGDMKLGQVLRTARLIDADTLSALLAEARRQRRSLRQVLLASGVITLYQLALIEAGNVDGLMLGPVRIIDRLRHSAHETIYRVFDPRRGVEAVLRHLAEADTSDAVKPDEFRRRFQQAMLNDPHLANTLEVLELAGRPAAEQEWLSGLPATDWPPLAAAPGVCYRLLTQAAQGLATAHRAGAVHGHLSDALMFLTPDGVLKICGLGEPPWLSGAQHDDEPTPRDDLRALGKIVSSWCTPAGVRKGAKTKPLPEPLVSVLYRLAADGDAGYKDVSELLDDLQQASAAIPANAEAWDRLLKYVREHGAAEAILRQSA